MNEENSGVTSTKSWTFVAALVLMLILVGLSINTDLQHYVSDDNVPMWFFYGLFFVDVLMVLSLLLIYFYKKIGVSLLPITVGIHYIMHNYYLSTTLYSDLNLLFVFVGIGLFVIIPRWKFYK